jgi:hypothetical protein
MACGSNFMSKRLSTRAEQTQAETPAKQVAGLILKFEPEIATVIRACRSALRKRLPTAIEQVYDNYNFLAIGFCTTQRTSDCILSLACSAKGVALSFYYGATLSDPHGVLQGSGSQNRFVRLASAATLREPAVAALIDDAVANARPPLAMNGRGMTIIKSVSVQQRPRRAPAEPRSNVRATSRGTPARSREQAATRKRPA